MDSSAVFIMVVFGALGLAAAISANLFLLFLIDRGLIESWPSQRSGKQFWRFVLRGTKNDLSTKDRRAFNRLRGFTAGSTLAVLVFWIGLLVVSRVLTP